MLNFPRVSHIEFLPRQDERIMQQSFCIRCQWPIESSCIIKHLLYHTFVMNLTVANRAEEVYMHSITGRH